MSDLIDEFQHWVTTLRDDVEAAKAVCEADAMPVPARKFMLGALNYLVARMDLIPDWNQTIGVVDDVFVLRICVSLAGNHGVLDHIEDADALVRLGRMLNQTEHIETFLGKDLYARLRKHCERLSDTEVRARTPDGLLADASMRRALYAEVHGDIARMPPAVVDDPDEVAVQLRSYLHHKLT